MKFKIFLTTALLSLFMCISFQTFAQTGIFNDTMLVFKTKGLFVGDIGVLKEGGQGFLLTKSSLQQFKPIGVGHAKKAKLPRATKVSSSPITIKHKGVCYQFGCQQGKECKDCKLVWYDRNGDRKVQPKRELRCVCAVGKQCRVRVRKSDCK